MDSRWILAHYGTLPANGPQVYHPDHGDSALPGLGVSGALFTSPAPVRPFYSVPSAIEVRSKASLAAAIRRASFQLPTNPASKRGLKYASPRGAEEHVPRVQKGS